MQTPTTAVEAVVNDNKGGNAAVEDTKGALTTTAMANESAEDTRLCQFTKKGEQES